MYILPFNPSSDDFYDRYPLSPRAALPSPPAASSSPSPSSIALYALIATTVLFLIGGFFLVRFVRRHKFSFRPNYSWLRGKGKGAKGRLGLVGVELLPTSMKSTLTPIPSSPIGVFAGSSNIGKDKDTSSLLSRSSSLEMLPTFTPHPTNAFSVRSSRNPFKFSMFHDHKSKSTSFPHRRSKSLSVPKRHVASSSSAASPLSASSPPTPSPQAPLIDFSTSNSSSSSTDISVSSSFSKATTSSDVGTHRFSPNAVVGPLIPIPMPAPSPKRQSTSKPTHTSHVWTFDYEEDDDEDPLVAAFKRSQARSTSPLHTPALLPSSSVSDAQPPTPSTAGFPLTPPPPGLPFGRLDMYATWSSKGKDRDISSPLSPSPTNVIELVSITPPSPSPIGAGLMDLASAPVYPFGFSASGWTNGHKMEELRLVDVGSKEEQTSQAESGLISIREKTFVLEPLVDVDCVCDKEQGVVEQHAPAHDSAITEELVPVAFIDVAQEETPVGWEVHHNEVERDAYMDNHSDWQDCNTAQPTNTQPDEDESDDEESLSPASSYSRSRSASPSPQYSPPLGMLHTSPLPISGTNLVDISRAPSPLDMGEPLPVLRVVPPSPRTSLGWQVDNVDETEDAWGFGTGAEKVDESSAGVGYGEDLIRFDGSDEAHNVAAGAPADSSEDIPAALGAVGMEEQELWFVEESTVVCNDFKDVAEVEDGLMDPETLESILSPVHIAKDLPILELFEEQNVQSMNVDDAKEMSSEVLLHQPSQNQGEENEAHIVLPTASLEPLSIPSPVTNQQNDLDKMFPDPDLLPLPPSPTLLSTQKPHTPPTIKIPAQMPTPPASPPLSPWLLDARSDFSGLTTPSSRPASPFTLNTPIVVSDASSPTLSAPTPSSATSTTSARPAWSLRAADAQALGIPAPSANITDVLPRTSPDMRIKMKVLTEDPVRTEVKEAEKVCDLPLPSPIKSSVSLPGTFPSPKSTPEPLPLSAPATIPPTAAEPTVPALRRRTPRSPLDIALAMQLRPGLGLGADPAWMVRFLMSMFGWFSILISGRGDFDEYMYAGEIGRRGR